MKLTVKKRKNAEGDEIVEVGGDAAFAYFGREQDLQPCIYQVRARRRARVRRTRPRGVVVMTPRVVELREFAPPTRALGELGADACRLPAVTKPIRLEDCDMRVTGSAHLIEEDGRTSDALAEATADNLKDCFHELEARMREHVEVGKAFDLTIEIRS